MSQKDSVLRWILHSPKRVSTDIVLPIGFRNQCILCEFVLELEQIKKYAPNQITMEKIRLYNKQGVPFRGTPCSYVFFADYYSRPKATLTALIANVIFRPIAMPGMTQG